MGVVYRARDDVLDREVALKLIRPRAAGETELRQRFLREARLAAAISHPGVATLYEAGEASPGGEYSGQLFLASELVAGESLEAMLQRGPMPVVDVIDLGVQLAEALAAAHGLGIVHRDVKPSNLMVTREGRLKVLDFGIAKRVPWAGSSDEDLTAPECTVEGAVVGTPAYMAPEQVTGGAVDARTDVHGAGCVLYQMLTGCPPFGTGAPSEVMRRVMVTPPKPLVALRPELPGALVEVVEKALAKDPVDRFQTALELADALRSVGPETAVRRAVQRIRHAVPRRTAMLVVLATAIAASLLAGKMLLGGRSHPL